MTPHFPHAARIYVHSNNGQTLDTYSLRAVVNGRYCCIWLSLIVISSLKQPRFHLCHMYICRHYHLAAHAASSDGRTDSYVLLFFHLLASSLIYL